jgi:preprotein translocase subunit SecG
MFTLILAIHIFVCFLLITAILIQPGKGSDISSALGGGVASDIFGPGAPANIMNKITTVLVIIFMITSISLTILSKSPYESSVIKNMERATTPIEEKKMPEKSE